MLHVITNRNMWFYMSYVLCKCFAILEKASLTKQKCHHSNTIHSDARMHTHTLPHTYAYSQTHRNTNTETHTHTHKHINIHTHTNARTNARTHTHTHSITQSLIHSFNSLGVYDVEYILFPNVYAGRRDRTCHPPASHPTTVFNTALASTKPVVPFQC